MSPLCPGLILQGVGQARQRAESWPKRAQPGEEKEAWGTPAGPQSSGFETGWDLGPFAAVLAPGHTSPQASKYKETIRD